MSRINFKRMKKKNLLSDVAGLALAEAALLFPVLVSLTFGIYDLGHAIVLNQKVISAAQICADLLARERSVDSTEVNQAIAAARLALDPYQGSGLGVDIVGLKFDSNDDPQECWRVTDGAITPNTGSIDNATGLGIENEGVIMVTTQYRFTPYFTGGILGSFDIEEVSFIRGRKNAYVPMEGVTC